MFIFIRGLIVIIIILIKQVAIQKNAIKLLYICENDKTKRK